MERDLLNGLATTKLMIYFLFNSNTSIFRPQSIDSKTKKGPKEPQNKKAKLSDEEEIRKHDQKDERESDTTNKKQSLMIDALPQPQRKAFNRGISSETIDKLTKKPETSAPSTSKCFQRSQSGNCYFYWMLNLLNPHNYTSSACKFFGQTYNPYFYFIFSVDSKLSKPSSSRLIPHQLSKEDQDNRKAKLAEIAMKNRKEKEPVVSDKVSF